MHHLDLATWRSKFAPEIVGESPEVVTALETIQYVADTACSILITGETGTGKELFARAAHRASSRRSGPFVAVNCAALPDSLLEAELFGHVKGAFTGATGTRAGRFVTADGGTLFLDEIGDLSLSAQAKLLRVLEERVVQPVGADVEVPVDVRILAATHCDLEAMVAEGTFRADLYFRLAVVPIKLPALRDRGDDIDQLADLVVARARERTGKHVDGLESSARAAIRAHAWPGNIRELVHHVERAVLLARHSKLRAADFRFAAAPAKVRATPPLGVPVVTAATHERPLDLKTALEDLERELIQRALTKSSGNRTEAAALLGLNRTTLVEKLRKHAA